MEVCKAFESLNNILKKRDSIVGKSLFWAFYITLIPIFVFLSCDNKKSQEPSKQLDGKEELTTNEMKEIREIDVPIIDMIDKWNPIIDWGHEIDLKFSFQIEQMLKDKKIYFYGHLEDIIYRDKNYICSFFTGSYVLKLKCSKGQVDILIKKPRKPSNWFDVLCPDFYPLPLYALIANIKNAEAQKRKEGLFIYETGDLLDFVFIDYYLPSVNEGLKRIDDNILNYVKSGQKNRKPGEIPSLWLHSNKPKKGELIPPNKEPEDMPKKKAFISPSAKRKSTPVW